jgi:hypothetical protein
MNKILITGLVLLSSFHLYAEESDYDYCNDTTNSVFKINPDKNSERNSIFQIDDNGHLVANEKKVAFDSYSTKNEDSVHKYETTSLKKGVDLNHSYSVKRDSKGRVVSIDQSCENCGPTHSVEFSYKKKDCLPQKVVRKNIDGSLELIADAQTCNKFIRIEKDLAKYQSKAESCLNSLELSYQEAEKHSKSMLKKLSEDGYRHNNSHKESFLDSLDFIKSNANKISRPIKNFEEEIGLRNEYKESMSRLIRKCITSFDKGMLLRDSNFKQHKLDAKKESNETTVSDD